MSKFRPTSAPRPARNAEKAARAVARAYRCGHCGGAEAEADGRFVSIRHDGGCPVLTGAVPASADEARALRRAAPGLPPGPVLLVAFPPRAGDGGAS